MVSDKYCYFLIQTWFKCDVCYKFQAITTNSWLFITSEWLPIIIKCEEKRVNQNNATHLLESQEFVSDHSQKHTARSIYSKHPILILFNYCNHIRPKIQLTTQEIVRHIPNQNSEDIDHIFHHSSICADNYGIQFLEMPIATQPNKCLCKIKLLVPPTRLDSKRISLFPRFLPWKYLQFGRR